MRYRVAITDHGFPNLDPERAVLGDDCELIEAQCRTPEEVIEATAGADAVLVQFAPVPASVIDSLDRCRVIVRYGIGTDNVDLAAARERGIAVCNVPDYCIGEVADHTLAMALALARQLPQIDRRTREGEWKLAPVAPMPAFRNMTFATAGFGKVAQAVLLRARVFGFVRAAYDPYVSEQEFEAAGVRPFSLDALFSEADILSLHLPLTDDTRHLVNERRLRQMRQHAILINTSRGAIVDTKALADALTNGTIAAAGIDVFEEEPLPEAHPLLQAKNAILSSHVAWYSEQSLPHLQHLAAMEVHRGLWGEPLNNQVNR